MSRFSNFIEFKNDKIFTNKLNGFPLNVVPKHWSFNTLLHLLLDLFCVFSSSIVEIYYLYNQMLYPVIKYPINTHFKSGHYFSFFPFEKSKNFVYYAPMQDTQPGKSLESIKEPDYDAIYLQYKDPKKANKKIPEVSIALAVQSNASVKKYDYSLMSVLMATLVGLFRFDYI